MLCKVLIQLSWISLNVLWGKHWLHNWELHSRQWHLVYHLQRGLVVVSRHATHLRVYCLATHLVQVVSDASCCRWVYRRVICSHAWSSWWDTRRILAVIWIWVGHVCIIGLISIVVLLDNWSEALLRLAVLKLCCESLRGRLRLWMHALNVNRLLNHSTTLVWHRLWCTTTNHSEAHILGRVLICQKL